MADPNLCETSRVDQPKRLQVSKKRKRSNWLRSIVASSTGISFPQSTGSHPHCGRSQHYSVKLVAIDNPDRCLVLRSNSVRAIDPCLSLCRWTRLLTPKLQQTDANPNLFVANQANRNLAIGCGKHVSRDNGNRPGAVSRRKMEL